MYNLHIYVQSVQCHDLILYLPVTRFYLLHEQLFNYKLNRETHLKFYF